MTEAEWLASDDPNAMLDFLREKQLTSRHEAGKRKVRLFGCASCWLFGDALSDLRSIAAVEYTERFADDKAAHAELADVQEQAGLAFFGITAWSREQQAAEAAWTVTGNAGGCVWAHAAMQFAVRESDTDARREWLAQRRALANLLRDIFGNPFRPVVFDPEWRSDTAVSLAKHIYEARDFATMPILADALQDAGCDNAVILSHCRVTNATHVRGCWVVDLVLGKS